MSVSLTFGFIQPLEVESMVTLSPWPMKSVGPQSCRPPLLLLMLSNMPILHPLPWLFFYIADGNSMDWCFSWPWKPPTATCLGDLGSSMQKLIRSCFPQHPTHYSYNAPRNSFSISTIQQHFLETLYG